MAEPLATAYIQLMPSLRGAQAQIQKEIQGSIQAPLAREAEKAGATSGKVLATAMSRELTAANAPALQAIRQQSQAVSGGIVASLKAAVTQYGGTKAVLAGLATQASSATQQLSGMVRGSAELGTATGGLKAGLLGVSGLLGGPWGIAIAGGSLALNAFAQAQQDAADRAKTLLDTLNAQTGKVTADTAAATAKAILDALNSADQSKLQQLGFTVQNATQAVLDGGTAFDTYRAKLEGAGAQIVKTRPMTDETAQAIRHMLGVLDVQHDALGDANSDWARSNESQKIATAIAANLTGQTNALANAVSAASGTYTIQITSNMAEVIDQAKKMILLLAKIPGGLASGSSSAAAALSDYVNQIGSGAIVDPITAKENAKKPKAPRSRGGGGRSSGASAAASARSALADLVGGSFATDLATSDRAGIARTGASVATAVRKALSGSTETALTALVRKDTTKLQALAGTRAAVAKRLEASQQSLATLAQAKASTTTSVTSAGLGNLVGARSASGIQRVLAKQLATVTAFRSNLGILAKRGLPKTFLEQLVAAGPDGAFTAAALVRSNDTDFATIQSLTNQLSAQASGLGKDAGAILYDPGIASMQGLIRGIKSQQPALDAAMLDVAKSMQKAIKGALGIHSPSKVFEDLGRQIPAGMDIGIQKNTYRVQDSIAAMASVATIAAPQPAPSAPPQIHVEIHGVTDPSEVAKMVSAELDWRSRNGIGGSHGFYR